MLPHPSIIIFPETKLIGIRQNMSFAQNTTHKLWAGFMPRKREITNATSNERFSLQNYTDGFFEDFSPLAPFEKWAAMAVNDFDSIPDGMETFTIPAGKYAVFHYTGNSKNAPEVFRYILAEWLPQSGYSLDTRPHFEILGDKYRNGDDDSEEDIYIPVK